ncbi:MAG: TIGR00289 family protein [Candidatus Micrarchaeia archaeon]
MRVSVLFSGGKDSMLALWNAVSYGWEVKALLTVLPELDSSYMFHHPNVELVPLQAEAMELPAILQRSSGKKDEELEDLKELIGSVEVDGVVTGAVASEYQKEKVDLICEELGVRSFAPLWHKDGEKLLKEMLEASFEIIITSVSAEGLDESWLGRRIDRRCVEELVELKEKYGVSVVGEGGELETFVLNSPLFKKRIEVEKAERRWDGVRGVYSIKQAKLTRK